ncbi:conserved hypothetical protein [Theileria equi strain WA]|uniref:BTB domain-containing protein n=1 Tax=Theileria equi strain WA TaxID=1537102 RepID=L1LDG8_THEEQ|nr:conserved hypothetical protein [Theileria equi strain WA]EKX73309.1 conserved hypothetical protein [Theileria equi strain WA]|eukprot:XP_004832761.1 conserved hypothetical protein [Theileria equi strain WA]
MEPVVNVRLSELTGRADINDDYTDMLLILRKPDRNIKERNLINDTVINVHSGVLRVASAFFMRTIDLLEDRRRNSIDVKGKSKNLHYVLDTNYPFVVQRIIYYIYKNDYQNMSEEPRHLVPLYKESVRFELQDLKNSVLRMIRSQASLEVLTSLASAAELAGEVELSSECGRILADSAFAVFSGNLHVKMGLMALKALLQSDNIQLDEVQVFAALCYYLDSNQNFHSPYSSTEIGSTEKELIKSIRFCSMSPKAISEFRCDAINSFLLDATLRMLLNTQLKERVFPWQENEEYRTINYNSLYPLMLVRVGKYSLSNLNHNESNLRLVTPQVDTESLESYPAFTHGTERESSEIFWAFEICRTKNGDFGIGIAIRSDDPLDEASRYTFSSMSKSKKIVFYYDFSEGKFKSGYIDSGAREMKSPWAYDSASNNKYKPSVRDVIVVRVNVAYSYINLEVSVIGANFNEKFSIPMKTKRFIGNLIKRPSIFASPFILTNDIGDALCIPELRANLVID